LVELLCNDCSQMTKTRPETTKDHLQATNARGEPTKVDVQTTKTVSGTTKVNIKSIGYSTDAFTIRIHFMAKGLSVHSPRKESRLKGFETLYRH
jgi:hypothetical protein